MSIKNRILLIDDEPPWLRSLRLSIVRSGVASDVLICDDSREALPILAAEDVSLVVMDLNMPHLHGKDLLPLILEQYPQTPVIVVSGMNEIEGAVDCMRLGAFDYYVKTVEEGRLIEGIKRALKVSLLRQENEALKSCILNQNRGTSEAFSSMIAEGPLMQSVFRYIEAISVSPEPVLISGESGTGKELVARAVHHLHGENTPYVAVNVAGLDDNVFSDTLFGHVKGAFTGAERSRGGMIEKSKGGILFLDEIGDLSLVSQVKLLRLLQEREYFPLGSDSPHRVEARIVVATNQNLPEQVKDGKFRNDLYYRLKAHHIALPPLRERSQDIVPLFTHFVVEASKQMGKDAPILSPSLQNKLLTYPFPGNVRELRAMVYDAVSVCSRSMLDIEDVTSFETGSLIDVDSGSETARSPQSTMFSAQLPTLKEVGHQLVNEAMKRADGRQAAAAQMLGITRPALSKRLKVMSED